MRYLRFLWFITLLLLGGCSSAIILNSKGSVGSYESSLILIAATLMLIVVLPAIVMTILFAWKYRQSNPNAKYTPNWSGSKKIEIVIWTIPSVIVLCLAILVWIYSHFLDPFHPIKSNKPAINVQVVSLDWKWLFIYPDQHIATVNQLVFPVNVPVHFYLTSATVLNNFFIPQLGGQIMTMAGMQNQLYLLANETGTYMGISSNFSGPGFTWMNFQAIACSEQDFNTWLNKVRKSSNKLDADQYAQLAKPSIKNPIEYFSTVQDHLFETIMNESKNAD